jgi:hypothetical protein
MRVTFLCLCLHLFFFVTAQTGNELLVYSMKGNVTVIEGNKESKLKIGKVIKPGATIKTQKFARLTMVCKEGRPISIVKEGSFPVGIWKDSCTASHASVSSKYFQYIWDQLYARSDDYRKDHPGGGSSEAPVRGQEEKDIVFNEFLDSIKYAGGVFPLSWITSFEYTGRYHFVLTNTKTKKQVFQDSLAVNTIQLDKLKKYMKPGNSYSWSVAAHETGIYDGGVINYIPLRSVNQHILSVKKTSEVVEEPAAQYFRIAYLLQQDRYIVDAYLYYRKAAEADPSTEFYTEMLKEFKTQFYIR